MNTTQFKEKVLTLKLNKAEINRITYLRTKAFKYDLRRLLDMKPKEVTNNNFKMVWQNLNKEMAREEPKQIKCYCGHTITCDCGELELECKDCNKSLENCTCIEDTIDMKQETLEEASKNPINYTKETNGYPKIQAFIDGAKWQINKQDEFTLGFLHWYNTSEECERYLRRNYPKNITMNGEHYKKVLEINKELLEMYKNTLPHGTVAERFNKT